MAHAEKCPVCKGSGQTIAYERPGFTTTVGGQFQQTCHGCHGKGWVTVEDTPVRPTFGMGIESGGRMAVSSPIGTGMEFVSYGATP